MSTIMIHCVETQNSQGKNADKKAKRPHTLKPTSLMESCGHMKARLKKVTLASHEAIQKKIQMVCTKAT
jgi:hypothetical protein